MRTVTLRSFFVALILGAFSLTVAEGSLIFQPVTEPSDTPHLLDDLGMKDFERWQKRVKNERVAFTLLAIRMAKDTVKQMRAAEREKSTSKAIEALEVALFRAFKTMETPPKEWATFPESLKQDYFDLKMVYVGGLSVVLEEKKSGGPQHTPKLTQTAWRSELEYRLSHLLWELPPDAWEGPPAVEEATKKQINALFEDLIEPRDVPKGPAEQKFCREHASQINALLKAPVYGQAQLDQLADLIEADREFSRQNKERSALSNAELGIMACRAESAKTTGKFPPEVENLVEHFSLFRGYFGIYCEAFTSEEIAAYISAHPKSVARAEVFFNYIARKLENDAIVLKRVEPRTFKSTPDESPLSMGTKHPSLPNLVAAEKPYTWVPAAGYVWISPLASHLDVVWHKGLMDPAQNGLESSPKVGQWRPADGYKWAHPDDPKDTSVVPKEFVGVGITVVIPKESGIAVVQDVFSDSPGGRAGIAKGEEIVSINGQSTRNKSLPDVVQLLKGEAGQTVKIELRDHTTRKARTLSVARGVVHP